MSISAVIVLYKNSQQDVETCLESLRRNKVWEIIIVDNSPEVTSQNIKSVISDHSAKYLPQSSNLGFATGADVGAKDASSDFILFINPDAYLVGDDLRGIGQFFEKRSKVGAIGLPLVSSEGQREEGSFGPAVTPFSVIARHFLKPALSDQSVGVGWVSGGAMIVRRKAYSQVGGFDRNFFLYWEDVDLCRRLKDSGWDIALADGPIVQHQKGVSLADNKKRTSLYDQSADKYFCKHYAKSTCLVLRLMRSVYRVFSSQAD